ncbi:MAG: hypothetical protein ACM3KD_12505, partial [Hyphomicrobiaceae bacterium]
MDRLNQDTLGYILQSAILAPSADNQHRVRFKIAGNTLRVMSTEASLPPPGGYKRALVLMSLGALLENLSIAASRFGIQAGAVLGPDPARPDFVLEIRMQPDKTAVDPLWRSIPLRHTNRRVLFRGPKMSSTERDEMEAAVQNFASGRLIWLDEPNARKRVLR